MEFHLASEAERAQVFRDTYAIWGRPGLGIEEHVQWRMSSPQHTRATWYVGCVDKRPVASLATYPLQFSRHGRIEQGIAIGAVHTLEEFRGRGFATQLFHWVENRESRQGARMSLLYSDINPEFYARVGYQRCPSWEGWADITGTDGSRMPIEASRAPLAASVGEETFLAFYDGCYRDQEILIARNSEYWNYLNQKEPEDRFYFFRDPDDRPCGYVRLAGDDQSLRIRDWAVDEPSDRAQGELLDAMLQFGQGSTKTRIGGWLPNTPAVRSRFALCERTLEITMLKSLSGAEQLSAAELQAAQHFLEIDHV